MKLSTVGYWRVSTDRQGREGVSLEDQAEAGARWCEAHGAELVESFVEDESAWTKRGARRPAWKAAITYIRAQGGKVRYFLVYDLSRFARSMRDQLRMTDELRALGVALQTVTLDLRDDAHGRAVAGYLGVTNQLQSDLASEKISAAMLTVTRGGRQPHLAPFGYRNARDAAGRKGIEPDPERAAMARRIFERAAAGVGPQAIAAELAALGARGRRGGALRPQEVRKILANRLYMGVVVSRKHGVEAPGAHEAIVDRELWERAQARPRAADRPLPPHRGAGEDFPLRGFARCAACGRPLTAARSRGKLGRTYGYYFCWAPGCRRVSVPAARLEERFAARLAAAALAPHRVDLVEAKLAALWRERRADEERARAVAERELADLRRRRDRLVEAFVFERAVDRATYDRQLERLDRAIADAHFEPRAEEIPTPELSDLLSAARPLLAAPSELWARADVHAKRRLQALIYPRGIEVDRELLRTPEMAFVFNAFGVAALRKAKVVEQKGASSNPGALVVLADWLAEAAAVVRLAA